MEDNSAVITISTADDAAYLKKCKYFLMVINYVREQVDLGLIEILKINGDDNIADALTKPLRDGKFEREESSIIRSWTSSFSFLHPFLTDCTDGVGVSSGLVPLLRESLQFASLGQANSVRATVDSQATVFPLLHLSHFQFSLHSVYLLPSRSLRDQRRLLPRRGLSEKRLINWFIVGRKVITTYFKYVVGPQYPWYILLQFRICNSKT